MMPSPPNDVLAVPANSMADSMMVWKGLSKASGVMVGLVPSTLERSREMYFVDKIDAQFLRIPFEPD